MCETEHISNEKVYPFGRIYLLVSDNRLCYVGSTILHIDMRFCMHRRASKYKSGKCSSRLLFDKSAEVKCVLLKEVSNITKRDLHKLEGDYIRKYDCVNKSIAGRTQKEYQTENKNKIKEYYQNYIKDNKEKQREYFKKYYIENKDKKRKYSKEYYEANKNKNKENTCV